MKGADGRGYTFRKPRSTPSACCRRSGRPASCARSRVDQTAAAHPAATAIVGSLARSVGIPFYRSRLAVMPDDPALGKFRETFGGTVGMLDEYITPGYEGITEIVSSFDLWKKWLEGGPGSRVDSRAFLKARLFDLVVGNWDRHQGQWRWARIPGHSLWVAAAGGRRPGVHALRGQGDGRGAQRGAALHALLGPVPEADRGADHQQLRRHPLAPGRRGVAGVRGGRPRARGPDDGRGDRRGRAPDAARVVRDRRRADDDRPAAAARRHRRLRPEVLPLPGRPRGRARLGLGPTWPPCSTKPTARSS